LGSAERAPFDEVIHTGGVILSCGSAPPGVPGWRDHYSKDREERNVTR
jgi:hypothetical protein